MSAGGWELSCCLSSCRGCLEGSFWIALCWSVNKNNSSKCSFSHCRVVISSDKNSLLCKPLEVAGLFTSFCLAILIQSHCSIYYGWILLCAYIGVDLIELSGIFFPLWTCFKWHCLDYQLPGWLVYMCRKALISSRDLWFRESLALGLLDCRSSVKASGVLRTEFSFLQISILIFFKVKRFLVLVAMKLCENSQTMPTVFAEVRGIAKASSSWGVFLICKM